MSLPMSMYHLDGFLGMCQSQGQFDVEHPNDIVAARISGFLGQSQSQG